ncbi:MAG: FHA domain-containing protein, partial [Limisphaerales bacterium]
MARLLIKTKGLANRTLELRLGVNHVGRDPDCDFPIGHSTVSSNHCELVVSTDGVLLRDCDSTNGTFVNGDLIREAWLLPGQEVKLGDVELFVENTEVNISIPQYERPRPKPPVVLADGAMLCPRHPQTPATYKCIYCNEIMCNFCVHIMRRKG